MRTMTITMGMSAVLAGLALAGCDTGEEAVEAGTLVWELQGLEPLGDGFVYEGWAIVDGEPVSTGRFGVDADGTPELDRFALTEAEAAGLEAFVLSIEPEVGDDPAPSAVKLLAGDVVGGAGDLSIAHPAALGTDLSDAVAPYILETPTSGDVADDYHQGIWWLAAELPPLPEGWTYEGWVVVGEPISTGTFDSPDQEDSDGAGPAAGPDGFPPNPGQDFIDPALSLVGGNAVISIEPVPDDSPAPFLLKPLADTIDDLGQGIAQDMDNNALANAPSGSVVLER